MMATSPTLVRPESAGEFRRGIQLPLHSDGRTYCLSLRETKGHTVEFVELSDERGTLLPGSGDIAATILALKP